MIWQLVERFDAEQVVYVDADSAVQARDAVRGRGSGEVIAVTNPEQVGPSRVPGRVVTVAKDDLPHWVREQMIDTGEIEEIA